MNAAVSRVQHEASGPDSPAFARIDEIHVEEVRIGSRRFGEPCAAAIVGREDLARCDYRECPDDRARQLGSADPTETQSGAG